MLDRYLPPTYNGLMLAVWCEGGKLSLREIQKPAPGPGEALVRVELAGICRTDIEIFRGYMAFQGVPGHEFVGEVEECGQKEWVGQRVVGEINLPCGSCSFCQSGLGRHCPNRTVLGIQGKNGAFANHLTLPVANLHRVPEGLSPEAAVFTEPVAACFEILEQVEAAGKKVAVLGNGKLGILAARVLAGAGPAGLVLAGKHPEKLSLVRRDGIDSMLLVEFLSRSRPPENRWDLVVEATGRAEGMKAALDSVKPRGVIVAKTTVAGNVPMDMSRVVVDEVTIIGSRCGPFEPALEALASGRVRVDDLVGGRYPLSGALEAFARAASPGALKVLLEPD